MDLDFSHPPFRTLDPGKAEQAEVIDTLLKEFYLEIAPGHPLFGEQVTFLARRDGTDDIIVKLDDGRIADVHLTWIGKPERPPWPIAGIFKDSSEY